MLEPPKDYDALWEQISVMEADAIRAEDRIRKLERAMRLALGHHDPHQVTPLVIREMLMEGLRA